MYRVNMPDTSPIEKRLAQNRVMRESGEETIGALRNELAALLAKGRKEGLPVTVMSRAAGISRETAHKLLPPKERR